MYSSRFTFGQVLLSGLADQAASDHEGVHLRGGEALPGVLRRADDRLAADVEAGVDDQRAAGLGVERFEQLVEAAVPRGIDGLHAGGVVDVRDRRDGRADGFDFRDPGERGGVSLLSVLVSSCIPASDASRLVLTRVGSTASVR